MKFFQQVAKASAGVGYAAAAVTAGASVATAGLMIGSVVGAASNAALNGLFNAAGLSDPKPSNSTTPAASEKTFHIYKR